MVLEKASDAVREILLIDPARTGTPPLREDHQHPIILQNPVAFPQGCLHLLPVPAPADRNALGQIAEQPFPELFLEIGPFGEVPGKGAKFFEMRAQGHEAIGQEHGIDEGQVISTDQPGAGVSAPQLRPVTTCGIQIPETVSPAP